MLIPTKIFPWPMANNLTVPFSLISIPHRVKQTTFQTETFLLELNIFYKGIEKHEIRIV